MTPHTRKGNQHDSQIYTPIPNSPSIPVVRDVDPATPILVDVTSHTRARLEAIDAKLDALIAGKNKARPGGLHKGVASATSTSTPKPADDDILYVRQILGRDPRHQRKPSRAKRLEIAK